MLLTIVVFSLQFKAVQTYIAKRAARYLSDELKTTVSIGSLYLKPFKSLVLEDLVVLDLQKDTLLSTPKFMVDLNELSLKRRVVDVNTIQINNGSFFLKRYKKGGNNLKFIIDYFDSGAAPKKKKKKPYEVRLGRVILNNMHLRYKNLRKKDTLLRGVNYDDAELRQLNGIFEGLNTRDHLAKLDIKNLTFKEKSGFYLKNLTAQTTIDTNSIELKNLLLVTNQSRLTNYYKMSFDRFEDFEDYENRVRMKAVFRKSHIASRDIAYFAPALLRMKLDLDVDGQVTGLVNSLKAKKLSVRAGKATHIKGDFTVRGLPNWEETFLDLKIEMAGTNKRDLDEILGNTTGRKTKVIPEIVAKFGNVNFNGSFTGFQNDFIAYGEFKTKLGRLVSDVNMKIDKKGEPSYSGNVSTYDFNLGDLLSEKSLGRVTSKLYVKGRGTELNRLSEALTGDVAYIDFNGYRYRNIKVDGTFDKKFFDGSLRVNDRNLKLTFDGGINFNPKLPVFNFKAEIRDARLRSLKLYKDSLRIAASFSTNFSGTNLNNIEGDLLINKIRLQNPRGIYNIDSLRLTANGRGIDRRLSINSDIFDASITGTYDLNTLVSYYKAIAKTYIPSLKTDIIRYNTQIFKFNLRVKRFEPIAPLIMPGLDLEDQAVLVGNFDSRNNTATLNGFIKKLKYRGVVANNIIIDESTTKDFLQAVVTSDRVDINDSLFIKNVNISNILRNDSLSMNVKMSNSDDANQLDLNGLIEFSKDTMARLSILPSLLKINNEDWQIQEKVRVSFDKGETRITNFDLSNGAQLLTINGTLSEDPADLLKVGFENFDLNTLNPFTRGFGVKLGGKVNGESNLYGILKAPRLNDNLKIDSLRFNDTDIGNLVDTSSYSSADNKVHLYTRVTTGGQETFKVTGAIDLAQKQLDVNVKMAESKLTILEPFVKKLVSNLRGNISADIDIKGSLNKPEINGEVELDEARLTVNYLRTPYTITDKVSVRNSVVELGDLVIADAEGNLAQATGTVDLNNINNPTLDVTVNAKNFMALNTTSKDNSVYYGRAYGSGVFRFNGPTDNMRIQIDAKTEKGTVFNLPLNSSETVSEKDFINFVTKDTVNTQKKLTSFDGLTLSFKLRIDPNTTANIYTALGNLSGKGNAELALNINSQGDFEMSGDYIIESGSFDFTAQEVINKQFAIRQGGTIRWTGNPTGAQINLKAIYSLRAGLRDLYTAANRDASNNNSSDRVNTEVEMGLTGLLLKPDIKLDIFFPSNPAIKEEFQSYFSDQNNLNLQAFSLIIRRSFTPGTGEGIGRQLTTGVTSTATELIFNQFNNVLSSLNLDFVDLNVRTFNDVNASFKFFDDRLIINAGVVDRRSSNDFSLIDFSRNAVASEIEALVLIRKDGSLTGKLANKPPTQQSIFLNSGISPTNNVTSLGLIYTTQFDTFSEFVKKLTGQYRRDIRKRQGGEQPKKTRQSVNREAVRNEEKSSQRR
ncbi:translocation/assembly module TamB [Pedobacter yulinensis]|uniref:Translocation/assembly module TamB n=1 Tax=Pedobacter yulinensis TaxID=2126353 RepID=A0A2T3HJ00_9SPHI|nr:translocation/assembly module TamB [Pedobacter yulinensis]